MSQISKDKWRVDFRKGYVGIYKDEIAAAHAYDKAAVAAAANMPVNFPGPGQEQAIKKQTVRGDSKKHA